MSTEETFYPQLVIEHTGQTFALEEGTVSIGSEADNTIILADPQVSAHHATIIWDSETGKYIIEDAGSTEGTFVNEQPVEEPQPLRHGDIIRVGATVIDFQLEGQAYASDVPPGAPSPDEKQASPASRNPVLIGILVALLAGFTILCCAISATLLFSGGGGKPTVTIRSPLDNAQIALGNEILLQATASGASDIILLEINVDGSLVASTTSTDPDGESSLTIQKPWTFTTAGTHEVSAVAYTASDKTSDTERIEVNVVSTGIGEPSTSTPTPEGAEPTAVPTDTPTPRPGAPQIEYFRANPQSINAGECTMLEWGEVTDATEARIDPDVGPVGTPDEAQICPDETTTYVLKATGPGGTTTASTTVSVAGPLADLTLDAISFQPNPPVQGEGTEVKITIRNQGPGPAGPFDWEFAPGPETPVRGRVDSGLNGGDTTVVTARWTPENAYASLTTVARVDINNEIPEIDENNNQLTAIIQVVPGTGGPGTVTSQSDAELDGYCSNDGSCSRRQDVLVGNGEFSSNVGELVWRGLMSFDISDIPAGATIDGVELRFYQAKVDGDPYGKLGNLVLEHVDYGSRLSNEAYNTPTLASAVLPAQSSPGTWYILSDPALSSWVQDDLNSGRPQFQLRLRWMQETDGGGEEDYVGMESGNNYFDTGNVPQVTINYSQ